MQNIVDNFLFSYFLLYLEIKDINMTIKAKASKKINIDEYCGIVDMHISNTTVATIKKIISLLFLWEKKNTENSVQSLCLRLIKAEL